MPPVRTYGLDAFTDLLQHFVFSQLRSTLDEAYTSRICFVIRKLCKHGLIVFLLAGTALLASGCADGTIHKTQNLDHGQSVFIDATQRAVINTSLTQGSWQAPGQVVPQRIICAEPSPDVGTAVARSFGAELEASVRDAGRGAGRLDASTAQALIKLAERSVTIQYLRDGLYQACQAYANGAITSTTYAVILGGIDETLVTTMMTEAAAGTVRDVNAAVGVWAASSGDVPSGASSPAAADQNEATTRTANSGESGGASPQGGSRIAKRTNQTANVTLPTSTTIRVTPNAGVAAEIARMHAAFINDPGIDSLMHACVTALDRPRTGDAFETELPGICRNILTPESLQNLGEASNRRVLALAAIELASNQARALEAAAHACAPGGDGEACKALRAALPSGAQSAALVQHVLSYARQDIAPTTPRIAAARY